MNEHGVFVIYMQLKIEIGCEHFFCKEVLGQLQLHPQCEEKQLECRLERKLDLCALQLEVVVPLL